MTVYGWDISNHDWGRHPVSLANAKTAGISLVTHKATEGNWYRDPYLPSFAKQLASTAFPVAGTYHVLNHGIDVNTQTDYWMAYVDSAAGLWSKHPCWIWQIDAEPLDGYEAPTKAEIVACGKRLESKGVPASKILVYGPKWVYGDGLKGIPYRLWASSYVSGSGTFKNLYPKVTAAQWATYSGQAPVILQYSSSSTIGAQPTCDANAIQVANAAALQRLFTGTSTDQEVDMADLTAAQLAQIQAACVAAVKAELPAIAKAVLTTDNIVPAPPGASDIKTNPYWSAASHLKNATYNATSANRLAADIDARVAALQAAVASLAATVANGAGGQIDTAAIAADIKAKLIADLGGSK